MKFDKNKQLLGAQISTSTENYLYNEKLFKQQTMKEKLPQCC